MLFKEPDRKGFWLCGLYNLGHKMWHTSDIRNTHMNGHGPVTVKIYKNRKGDWI